MNYDQALPESKKYQTGDNKEYEIEAIIDSTVYNQQANNQMPGFYYLILWKQYPEEENTWEPTLAIMHFWKLINTFYKEYAAKLIATSLSLDSTLSMARHLVLKELKQKCGCSSKGANKRGKN